MIIERLSREHRNIETLLAVLERELEIFDRGDRPDYEVIRAIISYFELYPELYHHPQEDLVFAKLKLRDPAAAAKVGNLTLEHQKGAERLRCVAQAVDGVLADTTLDVLLGDGGGSEPVVNEGDTLRELLVRIDDGCLRDPEGSVLAQALDDQRQRKARRPFHLAADRKHGKGRCETGQRRKHNHGGLFCICECLPALTG
jgi:hypothetical protein